MSDDDFDGVTVDDNVGVSLTIDPPDGNINYWEVKQDYLNREVYPEEDNEAAQTIRWNHGPTEVQGWLNTDTLDIAFTLTVAGISVRKITANMNENIEFKFDLAIAKGPVKLFMRHGNELWIHHHIQIRFDGSFEGDYKILRF